MSDNRTAIESLLYRMQKLDEKYEELKWLVSGTGGSYIGSLLTKKGVISKKLLNRLINELTDCLEEYRSYKEAQQKGFGVQMEPYHLTEQESIFYRSYLYLLLGLSLQQNSGPMTRWCEPGTWGALIERVNYPVTYKTMAEIDRDLIYTEELGMPLGSCLFRFTEGLFYDIYCAYRAITGRNFTENITEPEREAACKLMTDEEQYLIAHPAERERLEQEEQEAADNAMDEYIGDLMAGRVEEGPSPEEIYDDMDEKEPAIYYDEDGSADGWFRFFAGDKERFAESCIMVRRQYCNALVHGNLKDEITTAIRLYLYRQGLSKWGDDDSFFTVYTYMSKALKASKKHMEM